MKCSRLMFGLAALLPAIAVMAFEYPPTPRGGTVDDYHGTKVADPYRWLEDADSAETAAWVRTQNALTLPYLAGLPERAPLQSRLTELWNFERYGLPQRVAGQLFFSRNDGLQNQAVLYVQAGDAAPRVLLDPNTLSTDGTVALSNWEVSPDGRLFGYALARAGSDWNEFRVRDIATGKDLPDTLGRIKFSSLAWTHDNAGFFYSKYPEPPADREGKTFDDLANQKLYYHRLGQPQSQDRLIYERPDQPKWGYSAQVTEDGRYLVVSVWQGASSENALYVKDLGDAKKPALDAPMRKLVDNFEAEYLLVGNRGPVLLLQTSLKAPMRRIVSMDLRQPGAVTVRSVLPESRERLDGAAIVGGQLVVASMRDASSRLRRYTLEGKPLGEIALAGLGTVGALSGKAASSELFYSYASFNTPPTNYRADLKDGQSRVFNPLKLRFNPEDYVTEQVFYTSKDSTRIPMFISYKKGLKRTAPAPTLLYGYGGFDISLTPSFSVPNLVWMERGGVYAQANLRGGGEYGEAWHKAGTQARKQNVFDDFTAAAGYLIANGWTTPRHLAIAGRSNGGLLVGATLNQHPSLFAAALPGVGVMDMLRFHKFTIGWAWTGDYGSSDTPEGFKYLSAYSPYHNIKPGTRYPAVLVTTADHDDRVVPGHSFKYAAALQHAQAGEAPVLIRVDVKAGHGAGKPLAKSIEEWADSLAFIAHHTRGD